MLIINADDWGRSREETGAALECYRRGGITSATAMVFMRDSERAAGVAKDAGLDIGLHLNLSQPYDARAVPARAVEAQKRVIKFIKWGRIALLIYHPGLSRDFRDVFAAQLDEFQRLYGKPPSHLDGHHHRHLCANIVFGGILPKGMKVRRNFSFLPGQKSSLNRAYRRFIDRRLAREHGLTDYFFALNQTLDGGRMDYVTELSKRSNVEMMTHPVKKPEYDWLTGPRHLDTTRSLPMGTYATL
jgi:predicted glycoside hydrolase/deacetylase ChbG (UPF0249 family)